MNTTNCKSPGVGQVPLAKWHIKLGNHSLAEVMTESLAAEAEKAG